MDKYFTCAEPRFFTFEEMTRTDTGLDNRPSTWEQVENLMVTANRLDTVRGKFGKAVRVNCAFRSEAVNERVGGVLRDAHIPRRKASFAHLCVSFGAKSHYGKEHDRFGIRFYCSIEEIG